MLATILAGRGIRDHLPCLIAACLWAAEVATALFATGMRSCLHELLGAVTVSCTCWALLRHYLGERHLKPGEHLFTDADLAELERLYMAGLTAGTTGERRSLRSVKGASG
jgi:hypothetical protein